MDRSTLTKTILAGTAVLLAAGLGGICYQNSLVPALGVEDGKLCPLGNKPNAVSSQTSDPDRRVDALPFKESTEQTMLALKGAVESYGHFEIQEETEDYLYVVFSTPVMKFRDDTEFWLDEQTKLVQFRSASRAGHSDMGMNRKRYDALRGYYQKL